MRRDGCEAGLETEPLPAAAMVLAAPITLLAVRMILTGCLKSTVDLPGGCGVTPTPSPAGRCRGLRASLCGGLLSSGSTVLGFSSAFCRFLAAMVALGPLDEMRPLRGGSGGGSRLGVGACSPRKLPSASMDGWRIAAKSTDA